MRGGTAREPHRRLVGIVGRIQQDDLVAGMNQRLHAEKNASVPPAVIVISVSGDTRRPCSAITWCAIASRNAGSGHGGVLVQACAHVAGDELNQAWRRREIREAL